MTLSSQQAADHAEILRVVAEWAQSADREDWEALADTMTATVRRDYSSLGGPVDEKGVRELVEEWAGLLGGLEMHQHLIGLPSITLAGDDAAEAQAHFQAQHELHNESGGDQWTLGGRYRFDLSRTSSGWRISGITCTRLWSNGNPGILALAAERSAERVREGAPAG
jgi:hypothetical protein